MSNLQENLRITIFEIFEKAKILPKEQSIDPDLFQVQIVFIRDYENSVDGILESLFWEFKSQNTVEFLNTSSSEELFAGRRLLRQGLTMQ